MATLTTAITVGGAACGGSTGSPPAATPATDGGADVTVVATDASVEADASAEAATADAAIPSSAFVWVGSAAEACPLPPSACAGWPDASTEGVVTKYTSEETFGAQRLTRTFHVYVPRVVAEGAAPAPLVVMLHGGNLSGPRFLVSQTWTKLAAAPAEGLPWRPNGPLCRALPTAEANGRTYQTPGGVDCAPPVKTAVSTKPFIVVYPDGLADPGTTDTRHWEDGRVPSPGFDSPTPNRDDVGFIEHVISVLLGDKALKVDATRVYVGGASNGGMMTQRVASEIAKPRYPGLRRVAAFAAFVSDLPEPLGPLAGATVPFGLALFHGTDIDTPDCNTPGCTTPTVAGDGRMPFGATGGVHYVNSPDRGRVLSGPDTIASWRTSLGAAAGMAPTTTLTDVGYFSKRETTTYGTSSVALESWVTTGGGHGVLSTREDFLPAVRGWAFFSSFQRSASGVLTRGAPVGVSGDF